MPPYGIFKLANRQIWGNIAIGLGNRLSVFQNPLVDKITSYNEIDLTSGGGIDWGEQGHQRHLVVLHLDRHHAALFRDIGSGVHIVAAEADLNVSAADMGTMGGCR